MSMENAVNCDKLFADTDIFVIVTLSMFEYILILRKSLIAHYSYYIYVLNISMAVFDIIFNPEKYRLLQFEMVFVSGKFS